MPIIEIESEWRATGIRCPFCGGMTYSDGIHRPQCSHSSCLKVVPDQFIWTWLITKPEYRNQLRFIETNQG